MPKPISQLLQTGLVLFALSFAVACYSTTATFSPTGVKTFDRNPESCQVAVFSRPPTQPYEEIGVISFGGAHLYGPTTPQDALAKSRKIICDAGGDGLLLGEANLGGMYKKATVIKQSK